MISIEPNGYKALIVDENQELAACLQDMIDIFGIPSDLAHDSVDAMSLLEKESYSLIFIDTNISRICGQRLHTLVKQICPNIIVTLMSSYDSTDTNRIVVRDHPNFYLTKPFRISDLEKILNEIRPKAKK
jgi:DNA-binding response OmpR family regulator